MCFSLPYIGWGNHIDQGSFSKKNFYPHEESHEGLGATVLRFQTSVQVSENLVSARF